VFGKPVSLTLGLVLSTPYFLGILGWIFYQTFVIVSIEFWLRFEPHICRTNFAINFLFILARALKKIRLCVTMFFFLGEYSSVWHEICCVFSQLKSGFLRGISGKNYFGRILLKFCANQGYPLPKLVKFFLTFCSFILGSYCVEKIHTSSFSMLFAPM